MRSNRNMKGRLIIGSAAAIVLLSMMFLGPREEISLKGYLMHCVMPILAVALFWINYLWLIPRYSFQSNRKKTLFFYNLIIIVGLCTFLTYWHDVEFENKRNSITLAKQSFSDSIANARHDFPRGPMHDEMQHAPMHDDEVARGPMDDGEMPTPPDDVDKPPFGDEAHMEPHGEGMRTDSAEHKRHMDEMHMNRHHHPFFDKKDHFNILASLRDSVNFLFAIFVAFTLRNEEHITRLRQKQQEAETARRDAELRSLRNQISPHFLLNTLNNIYALAAISPERTQSAVMQLSKMLRHMLYDNQTEMVTLKSEVDFISSYVNLMKLRLASNVTVNTEFNVNESRNTMVAPLLFISLVENAFKHGVSSTEPCVINIRLAETDDAIVCDISNSNNPKQSNDHSGHGIGLPLVQQRLDMTYPDSHTWTKGVESDGLYHSLIVLKILTHNS